MRITWIPRDQKFYEMFDEVAALVVEAAQLLVNLVEKFDERGSYASQLVEVEHNCDLATERVFTALARTFVTPLDREDIHALASSLDDVVDNIEEVAFRMHAFQIERPTHEALQMSVLIRQAAGHLQRALHLCRNQLSSQEMDQALREVGRLENSADVVFRTVEAKLFASPPDILSLIKWREIYERLETTMDACRQVAHVISEIVVKGT